MGGYLVRRIAVIPFLLLAIVTVAFILSRLVPADPLATILSQRDITNPIAVAHAKQQWGLNHPVPVQYWRYLDNLLHGNLGTSFITKEGVGHDLAQRLPATLELAVAAVIIAVIASVGLGILTARRQNTLVDHGGRFFAILGSSIPVYWLGLLLALIFGVKLGWLPLSGRLAPSATPPPHYTGFYTVDALLSGQMSTFWQATRHLVLPAFCLAWGIIGTLTRIVRASMVESLGEDYVRTARAKGLNERLILFRHAFRNALIPTMTITGFSVAYLITGAVFVETIFSWPGVGSYTVNAAESLDFPAIMGVTLLAGASFLIVNLLTDVGYAYADPRVRLGEARR